LEISDHVITDIEEVTVDWLTAVLRQSGVLIKEYITDFTVTHTSNSVVSTHYFLQLAYSQTTTAPTNLFLKCFSLPPGFGDREYVFYHDLIPAMQAAGADTSFAVPCYHSAHDPVASRSHLLMQDVSATHTAAHLPLPAPLAHYEQIVDALAGFKAFWWDDEKLFTLGERPSLTHIQSLLQNAQPHFTNFVDFMGDRLTTQQRRALELVFANWPAHRQERLLNGQGLTLNHRDAHPANFLYPHDISQHPIKIIDWQSLRLDYDASTGDLAYTLAFFWYPARRAAQEQILVQRYYKKLRENGVTHYDWQECWYDYRASIIRYLFLLIGSWHEKRAANIWWHPVQLGLMAFEDLYCAELL
jgi:thiamine kinase-like enzyme